MKIINKILLTIIICSGTYAYVSAQNSDCAASCADIMAGAPADCGAVVNPASAGIPPGSTAQPEFGGDGSAFGCQEWVDVTDFSPIPGEPPAPGVGSVFTLCSSWTATLPDAAFPSFEGVVTAQGATACFGGNMIAVFDAATCAPAGTVTQPSPGIAGDVTGLTIGTTYVVCTTYDYTTATDVAGAPCTPDPSQLTAEICTEVVEFGTPPADPCVAVADPGLGFACSGSDFQIPLDVTGACTTDPTFDDAAIFGVPVQSGYIAFYYSTDGGATFTTCPPGSTADDVLTDPNFIFFGESNAAGGGGCAPVDIGAFVNPTCAPIDIPVCLLNGDVLNFFVAVDTDGDGINDVACDVVETTVTIYPNIETVVVSDGGCDNVAASFVTDGAGGIIGDLDGDGLVTAADACDIAVLGGNLLDPAVDPADTADDCADGSTLDYDFTPAYTADADYPGCVEPATGSLTCVCPSLECNSLPEPTPADACDGAAFQIPVDMGGCITDPNFDVFPTDGTAGTSGWIAFYYVDAAGAFTNCPAGSTADDVLANLNPPAGTAGFAFFGESNAAGGGGCAPVDIGAFTNPTCDPVTIPICLLNGDVTQFVVAFDTDGDGVNDITCDVFETSVTIYPSLTAQAVTDEGAICGTLTAALFDAAGNQCAGTEMMAMCAGEGDVPTISFPADASGFDCYAAQDVMGAACAACPACNIAPDMATNILCNDNGTPNDATDDTYTFDILVNGSNTDPAASGTFNDDQGNAGIAYGTTLSYGPFPISGGNITVTYTDVDDAACTAMMMATAPATCSVPVGACAITPAAATNILCNDNGTPADPSDDTYTFDILVNGSNTNAGASGTFNDDQGNTGIAYGTTLSYGPFPISGGNITVNFTDVDDAMCTGMMMATAPATCSNAMCSISSSVTSMCDDNGTPEDDSDDITTYTVTVTGTNASATYSDNQGNAGLAYGVPFMYTIIGTGGLSLTIEDDTDDTCTATLNQSSGCATVENIPTVGEWGLIILGLMMSITAIVGIRQRREEEATA